MKRISTLLLVILCALVGRAQDVIVMKNGDLVESQVLEISPTEIKYKKHSNPKGPTYTIAKSTVLAINYKNGEKEIIEAVEKTSAPKEETANAEIGQPNDSLNQHVIKLHNEGTVWYTKGEENKKKATLLMCQLQVSDKSVLANEDVTMLVGVKGGGREELHAISFKSITTRNALWKFGFGAKLYVRLHNRTDKTMYIDLANTFMKRANQSAPYYNPQVTSTTSGSNSSTTVSLGAFTGGLLNGMNVGSGSSESSTTVTYSERFVIVPPQSSRDLYPQYIIPREGPSPYTGIYMDGYDYHANMVLQMKRGQEYVWPEEQAPMKCGVYLTYSFDENFEHRGNTNCELYMYKVVGGSWHAGGRITLKSNSCLSFEAHSVKK